jgi:hypothetical protein
MKLLEAAKWRANPEVMRKITREYQLIYRRTWSTPVTRRVLANVPVRRMNVCAAMMSGRVISPHAPGWSQNLMLWDDHEVRNDWGRYDKVRVRRSRWRCISFLVMCRVLSGPRSKQSLLHRWLVRKASVLVVPTPTLGRSACSNAL